MIAEMVVSRDNTPKLAGVNKRVRIGEEPMDIDCATILPLISRVTFFKNSERMQSAFSIVIRFIYAGYAADFK